LTHFGASLTLARVTTKANPPAEEDAVRVELFRTQAVGIVDRAANGETFLALKSAGMDGQQDPQAAPPAEAQKAPEAPPAPPPAAAMKMPAAVKAAWMEKLGAVLDICAKLAEALQATEVDDAGPVPMELVQMAAAAEEGLGAMVEPYEEAMMAAAPPPPAAGEQAQKAAPAEGAAPPPKPPRPRLAMKRIMAMDGVSKAMLDGAQKLGELVGWAKGASGAPAPTAKDLTSAQKAVDLDPYTAMTATLNAIRERMWAACDLITKDPAKAITELREVGGMLDKAAILATGGGGAGGASAPAAPQAMTEEAQMAVQKAVREGVTSAKGELLDALKGELSSLVLAAKGAAASAQAALVKVEKSVPAPNGRPAGEIPTTPIGAPPPADPWREAQKDIQETSQARRKPAAGK
jgi:hypothetical protein